MKADQGKGLCFQTLNKLLTFTTLVWFRLYACATQKHENQKTQTAVALYGWQAKFYCLALGCCCTLEKNMSALANIGSHLLYAKKNKEEENIYR